MEWLRSLMTTNGIPTRPRPFGTSTPFIAADHTNDGKKHLLLAASGSVATIKLPLIVDALSRHNNLSIRIIITRSAGKFLVGQSKEQPILETLSAVNTVDGVHHDEDEWDNPWVRGARILHIEVRGFATFPSLSRFWLD